MLVFCLLELSGGLRHATNNAFSVGLVLTAFPSPDVSHRSHPSPIPNKRAHHHIRMAGLQEEALVSIAVMEKYTKEDQLLGAMQCASVLLSFDARVSINTHTHRLSHPTTPTSTRSRGGRLRIQRAGALVVRAGAGRGDHGGDLPRRALHCHRAAGGAGRQRGCGGGQRRHPGQRRARAPRAEPCGAAAMVRACVRTSMPEPF